MRVCFFGEMERLYGSKSVEIALGHPTTLTRILALLTAMQPDFAACWKDRELEDCLLVMCAKRICRADDVFSDDDELIIASPMDGG